VQQGELQKRLRIVSQLTVMLQGGHNRLQDDLNPCRLLQSTQHNTTEVPDRAQNNEATPEGPKRWPRGYIKCTQDGEAKECLVSIDSWQIYVINGTAAISSLVRLHVKAAADPQASDTLQYL
jgi:hypothetical protein